VPVNGKGIFIFRNHIRDLKTADISGFSAVHLLPDTRNRTSGNLSSLR